MLDTDTCIFLMRGTSPALDARVQAVPSNRLVMSAMTLAELSYGIKSSARARQPANQKLLDALIARIEVRDWPGHAADHYASIRLDLKKRGGQLGSGDLMIAAHACAIGATVVTNNIKDFGRVKGLAVENWTK